MNSRSEPGILEKLFALVIGAILLVLGFMFSVVLLGIIVAAGIGAFGYFWWKTRALRKAMHEHPQDSGSGQVIDGEVIIVEEYGVSTKDIPPHGPPER